MAWTAAAREKAKLARKKGVKLKDVLVALRSTRGGPRRAATTEGAVLAVKTKTPRKGSNYVGVPFGHVFKR